jgi:iron complex transport system permease protein
MWAWRLPFMALGWLLLILTARGLDALTLGGGRGGLAWHRPWPPASDDRLRHRERRRRGDGCGGRYRVRRSCGAAHPAPVPGWRPGLLLPASALGGAALVLAADIAVRLVLPDRDLKLGVLMAIVGAPLFLHLIYKTRRQLA